MKWGAIVVAAGRGTRFGRPKQLMEIAGKPMLAWSLELFAGLEGVEALVVTTEAEFAGQFEALTATHAARLDVKVVRGGAERQDSVRIALAALPDRCEAVLVHDGARPLVRAEEVRRGMDAVGPGTAAFLAIPVVDTIKEVDPQRRVVRTIERNLLWAAQTPQFALTADLRRAHEEAVRDGVRVTDDATLLERAGLCVIAVEASPENFKVTHPSDLERAETILRERAARHAPR